MTTDIVAALVKIQRDSDVKDQQIPGDQSSSIEQPLEPSLHNPAVGKPISHGQVLELSRELKIRGESSYNLDILLRGAKIYIAPPPPKPEPTNEYKSLMARLRREEEARAYERMLNSPPSLESFAQRFPQASAAHAFSSTSAYSPLNGPAAGAADNVTYDDISRQATLIINVLVSIFACAAAIWMAAKWWDTPARLALAMGGSLLVGIAEVVVYTGYLRRIGEAKGKEANVKEVKEIVKTWVIGPDELQQQHGHAEVNELLEGGERASPSLRKRKKAAL